RLKIGHNQNLRLSRNRGFDAFNTRSLRADCVVERERSIKLAAGDLAAFCHLAKRSSFNRRRYPCGDVFNCRENGDLWRAKAQPVVKIDCVLNDVAFGLEIWSYVHSSIGDEQSLRMRRNVHNEHVADAPSSTKPVLPLRDCTEELVGMKASFHQ